MCDDYPTTEKQNYTVFSYTFPRLILDIPRAGFVEVCVCVCVVRAIKINKIKKIKYKSNYGTEHDGGIFAAF